jgi:hypothetical protein
MLSTRDDVLVPVALRDGAGLLGGRPLPVDGAAMRTTSPTLWVNPLPGAPRSWVGANIVRQAPAGASKSWASAPHPVTQPYQRWLGDGPSSRYDIFIRLR